MTDILNVIAPVFCLIACGYLASKAGLIGREGAKGLNNFVFYFCIPPLLFRTMQTVDMTGAAPLGLWGAYYTGAAIVWIVIALAARRVRGLGGAGGAAAAVASTFGNLGMMGLSISYLAFGEEALIVAALIIAIHAATHWFLGSLWAELARRQSGVNVAKIAGGVFVSLIKNPIVLGLLIGAAWNAGGLTMPVVGQRLIDLAGDAAIPAGLFALGLTLAGFPLRGNLIGVATIIALKMAAFPLVVWTLAAFVFHLPPRETAMVALFAALPTGMNAYLFAAKFDAAVAAVSGAIALGVVLSAATIPFVLWLVGG